MDLDSLGINSMLCLCNSCLCNITTYGILSLSFGCIGRIKLADLSPNRWKNFMDFNLGSNQVDSEEIFGFTS